MPSRTSADLSADMALGGSGHADTINSYPTRAACFSDLRGHPVRLMKRPVGVLPNAVVHWLVPYAAARLTLIPGLGGFHVGCEGKTDRATD